MHCACSVGTAASWTEGRTIGLALSACPLVLDIDFGCAAFVVDCVVFAVGHITCNAGIDFTALFFVHRKASIRLLFHIYYLRSLIDYSEEKWLYML